MTTFEIDTFQFIKKLQKAGLDQKIAEVLVEEINHSAQEFNSNNATKNDIKLLQKDIKNLDQKFEQKLINLEQRLTIKLGLMMTAAIAIIAWLDKII
jgi:hypothetical protein